MTPVQPLLFSMFVGVALGAAPAHAFEAHRIAAGAPGVRLDGVQDEAFWQAAPAHTRFYETKPADNADAGVRTGVRIAYDAGHLYIGLRAWDADPAALRAPFARRDKFSNDQDYIGLLLDPAGTGKSAQTIYVNPRGALSDGTFSNTGGDDLAPDFDIDVATARFDGGWSAEVRVPFSSVAYAALQQAPWRLLVTRNMTREQRYIFHSSPVRRDSNCTLCSAEAITGLNGLPTGMTWSATPQLVARRVREEVAGAPRRNAGSAALSLDLKLRPDSASIVDLTLNPDFSQVELDAPQLSGNTRFGLFEQEKRPFFLEGSDILAGPMKAINTRSISDPSWGARYTRRTQDANFTLLSARDAGGGLVQLPNAYYTDFAVQRSASQASVARGKVNLGALALGAVGTDRSYAGGRGYNRVAGADFEWQRGAGERVRGQILASATTAHSDGHGGLAEAARRDGHAALLNWSIERQGWSSFTGFEEASDGFRADNGFFSQAGFRAFNTLLIKKHGKAGPINEHNLYVFAEHKVDRTGAVINDEVSIGTWMAGPYDSELEMHVMPRQRSRMAEGGPLFETTRFGGRVGVTPGRTLARLELSAELGDHIDVVGARVGRGGTLRAYARLRPSDRIEFEPSWSGNWIDAGGGGEKGRRLYTEQALQVKAIYHFGPKDTLRMIAQQSRTRRDPAMYAVPVVPSSNSVATSLVYGHTAGLGTAGYLGLTWSRGEAPGHQPARRLNELFIKLSWRR
ncbi:carbohydrate binding family 9 domain-containing protein [Massilia glaciei]|uniref:Carbohydrate-binding domain-containing protein n=1 Tax=Massilia glaciei TaxID=1524097 RepID=A0A2U2I5H7_9BURK|nr:carbohydrate binding family 9 domain-containing protein [Massilia glaciei]PWF54972.1 hypothetical protein C7C56_004230 [Massilia glaciei]